MPIEFRVKRIYAPSADEDGFRVLVDRLWPRGLSKSKAQIDHWAKGFAPSANLRKWFHADCGRYHEFALEYRKELEEHRTEIQQTINAFNQPIITLLTAVKDPERSHITVLEPFLVELSENAPTHRGRE